MKRTIVKMKLTDRTEFVRVLGDINFTFGEPYWQHDRIFVPRNFNREKSQPRLILRAIAKKDEKDTIYAIVLRRHFEDKKFDIVNSTKVNDYTEAVHILYQLGYELKYEVSRQREELYMGDSIRVCIDKVDNLPGYYAKIESNLNENDNTEDAYLDIIETFRVLGENSDPIPMTYGELIESSAHQIDA